MRFTHTDLKNTLNHINTKLDAKGKGEFLLKSEARGGYYGLDVYKGTRCIRTLTISKTPKGLVGEAYEWAFDKLAD